MRESGILLHVSSLPNKYGIGSFGKEAYKFVDFLDKTDQSYWQILPLGPTSYGDSPYQTFSVNALNPYFIDIELLVKEKLLRKKELGNIDQNKKIDYAKLYNERFLILEKAFNRFNLNDSGFKQFVMNSWVQDYALFMAIKTHHNNVSWNNWPQELKVRNNEAIDKCKTELIDKINFNLFLQYIAYKQYNNLKTYANQKGIKIIGDIPIYVAYDSSDVWTNPHLFQLNDTLQMANIAGVPPDNFNADGQLWGNPLYNWEVHERENFSWWIKRIKDQTNLYDMIRIDHFIGFENYFSIPATDKTAVNGKWIKGPGIKLFREVKNQLGDLNIIAEDLGVITDDVRALLRETNFPGMKLLQFAFDSRETSDYLPFLYSENTIAYTGTHDNETTRQWFKNLNKNDLKYCLNFINSEVKGKEVDSLIKVTLGSKSKIAIIPMQDYLNLGSEARMNIPSTLGGNWAWKMSSDYYNAKLIKKIKLWINIYGRRKKIK